MNTNNSNIGHSSNIPEFKWYAPNGQDHINGVKFTAPAFDVPPTPASSYSNLHVVLEPHSHVVTSAPSLPTFLPSSFSTRSIQTSSFDSTPALEPTISSTHVFESEFSAIPSAIDPEQPGARSEEALMSLKSEVAPMVPLEEIEYDSLVERTDRSLPEAVDLTLVDLEEDSDDYYSRSVDEHWSKSWRSVGFELMDSFGAKKSLDSFNFSRKRNYNLDKLEDAERLWRSSLDVNRTFATNWKLVGVEIINFPGYGSWSIWMSGLKNSLVNKSNSLLDSAKEMVSELKETANELLAETPVETFYFNYSMPLDYSRSKLYASLDLLEEKERTYRIGRSVDAIWSGRIHKVGLELISTYGTLGSISAWFSNLKSKYIKPAEFKADFVAPAYLGLDLGLDVYSFSRGSTSYITALEEEERAYRISKGVDAVLFGKWHKIGLDLTLNYFGSHSWFAWLRDLERSLEASALDTMDSLKTKPAYISPRDVGTDFFRPDAIDFTFRSSRVSLEIIELEEQERAYRIQQGADPVLYGLWFKIGLELKHKYSLRPTIISTANKLVRVASDLAEKAELVIESISEKGHELYESAQNTIISHDLKSAELGSDFMVHDGLPLNYFAYTAEPIDFTFKSRRCPAYIIALEEEERAYRISKGVDAVLYGKWNAILSAPNAKTLLPVPVVASFARAASDVVEQAKETLIEKTSELSGMAHVLRDSASELIHDAAPKSGWTGLMGSLAHSLADRTHHFVDVAKESMGIVDAASIAGITKAEEAERLRRMNEKVDPMLSARLGRVNDELLRSVKSV